MSVRNIRNVSSISARNYKRAPLAAKRPAPAERCILAGSRPGDTVLDPFSGAATISMVV